MSNIESPNTKDDHRNKTHGNPLKLIISKKNKEPHPSSLSPASGIFDLLRRGVRGEVKIFRVFNHSVNTRD